MLTAKSDLRKHIIDVLHSNSIEIVSPTFMNQRQMPSNQRQMPSDARVVPETTYAKKAETKTDEKEAPEI